MAHGYHNARFILNKDNRNFRRLEKNLSELRVGCDGILLKEFLYEQYKNGLKVWLNR